ncbi:hypothetical protein [Vibrio vulnificus]|uniref:hypothetical protein n=1 Tax=Vibrio vulnificus TaxID=672 RepID=UPI00155DCF0E|nr:hypothetical protein [Vibrio vulnificus]
MTNLEKLQLTLFVYTVSNAMLISTSKIVGKTVVVRVRRCVVGDFFFCVEKLEVGIARPRQSLQGLDNTASAYCSCFCY